MKQIYEFANSSSQLIFHVGPFISVVMRTDSEKIRKMSFRDVKVSESAEDITNHWVSTGSILNHHSTITPIFWIRRKT